MPQVKQSFVWDCFARGNRTPEQLVKTAAEIGLAGVELVEPQFWPLIQDHGLEIVAITGHPLNPVGLNKRENLPELKRHICERLEQAVKWNIPLLLCFSGNRYGIDEETTAKITAENLVHISEW